VRTTVAIAALATLPHIAIGPFAWYGHPLVGGSACHCGFFRILFWVICWG
jgi:hypothetical protein